MSIPWFDRQSGETFELPFVPQSREELERILSEMRARREVEVQAPTGRFTEDIGPALGAAGGSQPGQAANWFANAPALKSVADALRAPGGREIARSVIPGFGTVEAIPGLIGAGGAAIGASWDQPLEDVPDVDEIIRREAEEGLPTLLEQVAPVDIATVGLSAASAGARSIPRLARAAAPLAKTARASDIFEGVFGGGQVVHGVATGDPLEAGAGLVRAAGGIGSALPSSTRQIDIGAATRQGLEDVAPYVETAARELGYTDLPVPVSRMVPEGPSVPEGYVRVYRSGEGNFFTTNERRAGSYEGEGSFVDVPQEVFDAGRVEAAKYGQPTPQDTFLPNEWVKKAQRAQLEKETFDATEEVDADALFAELGVKRTESSAKLHLPKEFDNFGPPSGFKSDEALDRALKSSLNEDEQFRYLLQEEFGGFSNTSKAMGLKVWRDRFGRDPHLDPGRAEELGFLSEPESSPLGEVGPLGEEAPPYTGNDPFKIIEELEKHPYTPQPPQWRGGLVEPEMPLLKVPEAPLSEPTTVTGAPRKSNLKRLREQGKGGDAQSILDEELDKAWAESEARGVEVDDVGVSPELIKKGDFLGESERPSVEGEAARAAGELRQAETLRDSLPPGPERDAMEEIVVGLKEQAGIIEVTPEQIFDEVMGKPEVQGAPRATSEEVEWKPEKTSASIAQHPSGPPLGIEDVFESSIGKQTTLSPEMVDIEAVAKQMTDPEKVLLSDAVKSVTGSSQISPLTLEQMRKITSSIDSSTPIGASLIEKIQRINVSELKPFNPAQANAVDLGIEDAPIPRSDAVQGVQQGVQAEAIAGSPGGADPLEPIAPPTKPALEATLPKQKGQSFVEFMKEKFGDKKTTSRERALARAEWNQARQEKKLLKLAEEAGIPPDKIKAAMGGGPKESEPEIGQLGKWRRAVSPVIENFGRIHPELKKWFQKYVDEAEAPAMKNIADMWRIKRSLDSAGKKEFVNILSGKKNVTSASSPAVAQAARNARAMLDQTLINARDSGVISKEVYEKIVAKHGRGDAGTYFPHKFAEGWDDALVQNLHMDESWNLKESSLEKRRLSDRSDYRRDMDVLDEYFLSTYRRISEVQNFGKRLEVLKNFAKKHVTDKATATWLRTNVRRVMGREHPEGFIQEHAGSVRHAQALSDLGLAGFYQPIQATNTTLYGGIGRSARALQRLARDAPNEMYDAIRSGALAPDVTQEFVAGAFGAGENVPRFIAKSMYGIPTIDKVTRIHANTVGKLMVEDALKGGLRGRLVVKDIKALGFDVKNLADIQKMVDADPNFALKVGKELSDRALFRTGALEVPGWTSSTTGKLATQYTRFMYRHTLFVKEVFSQAAHGNVRPLARFLAVAPLVIQPMAEGLYAIREGLREAAGQAVTGEADPKQIWKKAIGEEPTGWNDEIEWQDILKNKRIPISHPLYRALQNMTLWGGVGVLQMIVERTLQGGSAVEKGVSLLAGPVPSTILQGAGTISQDINAGIAPSDPWKPKQWPGRKTAKLTTQQLPVVGHRVAKKIFPSDKDWWK